MRAIVAGSFDPITIGHLSLIQKGARLFDGVTVLLCENFDKKTTFTVEERLEMIRASVEGMEGVSVEYHTGWLYDYLNAHDDVLLFKGVRNAVDFDYEKKMADFNFEHSGKETVFVFSEPELAEVSSTKIRNLLASNGEWEAFIPQNAQKLVKKFYKNF